MFLKISKNTFNMVELEHHVHFYLFISIKPIFVAFVLKELWFDNLLEYIIEIFQTMSWSSVHKIFLMFNIIFLNVIPSS
jgi:hypothetical protein